MAGFINTKLVTTGNYRAFADLSLQFTVTQSLMFSVFNKHIAATDLQKSHHHYSRHKDFSSLADFNSKLNGRFLHHLPTANSGNLNPILCYNCKLPLCHLFSVIFANLNFWLSAHLGNSGTQIILAAWDPRYISSGRTQRKHHFIYCCVLILCCRNVFTAQSCSNERDANPQRMPLATPLLLLRDVTAYVTSSSAARARAFM